MIFEMKGRWYAERYTYKIRRFKNYDRDATIEHELDELGAEGWEIIDVHHHLEADPHYDSPIHYATVTLRSMWPYELPA